MEKTMGLTACGLYWHGAKIMLWTLYDRGLVDFHPEIPKSKGKEAYNKAVMEWIMSDVSNLETFLSGSEYYYTDHKMDDKGRLVSCRVVEKREKIKDR